MLPVFKGHAFDIGAAEFDPAVTDGTTVSISDVTTVEGQAAVFTVSLNQNPTAFVTLRIDTLDGSARAGSDYSSLSTSLTFQPGAALTQTVTVNTHDNELAENRERFEVVLSGLTGAVFADSRGLGTIDDHSGDALPLLDAPDRFPQTDQPTFTWQVVEGAGRYILHVLNILFSQISSRHAGGCGHARSDVDKR